MAITFPDVIDEIRRAVVAVVDEKAINAVAKCYAGDADVSKGNEGSSRSSRLYQVDSVSS